MSSTAAVDRQRDTRLSGGIIPFLARACALALEAATAVIAFDDAVVAQRQVDARMTEGLAAVAGHFLHVVFDSYDFRHQTHLCRPVSLIQPKPAARAGSQDPGPAIGDGPPHLGTALYRIRAAPVPGLDLRRKIRFT